MARKAKVPEHENLERWMVSYADFVTLLFATFVVLYALSQVDIKDFKALEDSIRQAFAAPSVIQGSDGVMQDTSNSIFDSQQADSMITPLMMEYMSQKYEEQSMNDIEKSINQEAKEGIIDGVEAIQTDRGLLIRFNDDYLFAEGSANLNQKALKKLDKVGAIIGKKFILHNMRVEGHTDNHPISSGAYPSNWELSGARASSIIRYFISRFGFMPGIFTAIGFSDTRPIADNSTPTGRAKNRRVEILILKNKFRGQESPINMSKISKTEQEQIQAKRMTTINNIEGMSEAAKNLANGDKEQEKNAIIINQAYDKEVKRVSQQTQALDSKSRQAITGQGSWLRPPASKKPSRIGWD